MRHVLLALLLPAFLAAQHNSLTKEEIAEGWVLLFDGDTLFGWHPQGGANWRASNGLLAAESGESGWLRTGAVFADFHLKTEFRTAADGNSGIFVRSAREGQPHITGYEVQIWNHHPKFPTGSLVNHVATPQKADLKPGEWNSMEVRAENDRYVVSLNGKQILDAREGKTKKGHIGLQFNKGLPIEFRNVKLKPLSLTPVFDGKTLSGWRKVDTPRAKEPPVWSVRDGMLHVEKGPGQLETEDLWMNFVLQMAIRTNPANPGHHPNSGVFMRGDPNGFWSGYEAQIRNEYKDGDPTSPVDFGTGAIYHYQPARRIVAKDGEFFTKTIIANGRNFTIWINGWPVTDWEDPHPEGTVVRNKQAKLGPGTISLQAHDPTTNLDFKDIRMVGLP